MDDPRFETLARVVQIANTSVDINERLDGILGVVHKHLQARITVLFMQEHNKGELISANWWPPQPRDQEPVVAPFGQGRVGEAARWREMSQVRLTETPGDEVLLRLGHPEESALVLPVRDDNRLYAVLVLIIPAPMELSDQDLLLVQMVAREMAGTIRNFRLYFEAKKRIAELNVLSDLGRAAVSTIEVDQLLDTVAAVCSKLLGARGGLVRIATRNGGGDPLTAVYGQVPEQCRSHQGCLDCPQNQQGPAGDGSWACQPFTSLSRAEQGICVPFSFKGNYQGYLCVFGKALREKGAPEGFTPDDKNLLSAMCSMVSGALENAFTFQRLEDLAQRNEEMVGALATLFEISRVLMTTVDFDETVGILLHAIIHPVGLGHDRAVLFLLNEADKMLRPVAELSRSPEKAPQRELTQALMEVKNQERWASRPLDDELARLELPLDLERSVLARIVFEGRPIQVDDPENDANVSRLFVKTLGNHPFVAVPMFAKGKAVGALVVNNFLSRRPFSDRDLKLLTMLASLGGLAVENTRLYKNLENANRELALMRNRLLEADKLAALGEIAAGVAHEIRNPLVSIGGFTRRIRKKVGDDSPITSYLDVIIEESTRLERTLNEMLDFSSESRNLFEEHQLSAIMDQALDLLARDMAEKQVEVVRDYAPHLPAIYCDDRQVKHVFLNLLLNAMQALGGLPGRVYLRTFSVTREGKKFVAGEVTDSGGGIGLDVIHKIFNPFFTTKDTGSGLGLSIVHKIITRHLGQVEVHNREGVGASFLVTLPAAEEGRAYLK